MFHQTHLNFCLVHTWGAVCDWLKPQDWQSDITVGSLREALNPQRNRLTLIACYFG